ncbi:MAG: radical SAM protein [Candidatus Acidulodesulfobacterium ferriphilum]|uniref:Radical SAM protein n=1 Tax=Candidatus Acidulodesulfobacterium ferriphilum TaxID=2597223 RepID=A0A519BCE1_9DELT|nr:MAG: radical SAM protein [Candidatus Acidulodesulfobacterium ferriphilum]
MKNIFNNININNINKLYDLYLKSEQNRLIKRKDASLNAVIVFPNYYGVAMSNLGFLRAYELINQSGFISCDRAFLQDDTSKGIISLETGKRLQTYDLIFFSLSYENDFYNILSILDAGQIPFLSADRDKTFPLIMAGGVIAFLNPEPVAPIFDMLFVGEAEAIFPDFFKNIEKHNRISLKKNKNEIIEDCGKISGIYVPAAYQFIFDAKKVNVLKEIKILPRFPEKIKRRWAGKDFISSSAITTKFSELSNINMIEIERGCKRGCRFCSAGYIYLPLRESKPDDVLKTIESLNENEKAGFVGLGTMDSKNIRRFMEFSLNSKKPFSLSSIRFDCLDENNLNLIKETGLKTITLGIETGSSRLKRLINKDIKNEEIIIVLKNIIEKGIMNIKSYFMVGLPCEEKQDLDETINLIKTMQKEFVSSSKINKRIGSLTVSFSPFVPKAWTPLQWENLEDLTILRHKMDYISNSLKHLPNLNIKINQVKSAYIEAFFARGSRLSLDILINSHKNKISLKKAAKSSGFNINDFIRKFNTNELLPWEIIDQGVTKKYLLKEYKNSTLFKTTPQCFEGCKRCGVC